MTNSNFAHFMPDENEDSIITYFFFVKKTKKTTSKKLSSVKAKSKEYPTLVIFKMYDSFYACFNNLFRVCSSKQKEHISYATPAPLYLAGPM